MARLPYLEADQVAPEYRDMLKRNTNLHKLLVNSPDMARAFNGIGGYIRFKSKLDPRLRELAILQVGWMEKSEYEFTHHVKIGKEFGVTDDDIVALMAETAGKPSKLEPLAKAILRGAREMVRELAMSDATFAEIKKDLSDELMVDLVPVVFGRGVRFFGDIARTPALLDDPEVVRGARVTHLRYRVRR